MPPAFGEVHGRRGPRRRIQVALFVLLCLLSLGLNIAFFVISVRNVPASSDEAIGSLQALDIRHGQCPLLFLALPYQFPLESYLTAPVAPWLPSNAFGARLIPALLSLMAVVLALLVLRRLLPWFRSWPGVLLILVPPAYLLMVQTAYAMPQHSTMVLLAALIAYLVTFLQGSIARACLLAGLIGALAGLAFTNHMLSLPLLIMATLCIAMSGEWKRSLAAMPAFAAGALLGLAPHFAANMLFPGAHQAVSQISSWADTRHLMAALFSQTLPGAFGINPCLFPDVKDQLNLFQDLALPFSALWVVILLAVTGRRVAAFVRATRRNRWPTLEVWDLFLGISWMVVLLFLRSARSQDHSYRYVLLAVWVFPFLVSYLYSRLPRKGRWVVGAVVGALVAMNLMTSLALMQRWAAPRFAEQVANIFDLQPALDVLKQKGITRCFASFWVAYRIDYETKGAIVASQPMNERFPRWPIPYKQQVLASDRVAYVLAPNTALLWGEFEKDLAAMGVTCQVTEVGCLRICADFVDNLGRRPIEKIANPALRATASCKSELAGRLVDGDRASRWVSRKNQERGMWVQCEWNQMEKVSRVALFYNRYPYDQARALTIQLRGPDGWLTVCTNLPAKLDAFDFTRRYPVYDEDVQLIRIELQLANVVRLEVSEPRPGRNWSIGEIEIYRIVD